MKARFLSFLKNKKVSIPVIIVIVLILISLGGGGKDVVTHTVERTDFIQETRVSGKITPLDEAVLSFNTSGKVGEVLVDVGDVVKRGDVLARLDRNDLAASLSEAQANLLLEQRQLQELTRGTRQEEIRIQEVRVDTAQATYDDALVALVLQAQKTYTVADSLFKNDISQLFQSPFSPFAKIVPVMNAKGQSTINAQYESVYTMINKWYDLSASLSVDSYNQSTISTIQANLTTLRNYADLVATAVSDFEPVGSYTQAIIDDYKADITSGRNSLDSTIASLAAAKEAVVSAENNLRFEESNLALLQSGSTVEDIAIQQARIAAGSARVSSARAEVDDSQIIAPFDGVIAKRSINVGGNVTSQTEALVLVAENGLEIESYIPELLIRNVTIEDPAEIIFDAYPEKTFNGVVTSVDSKDTLRDGVTTYKTLLQMTDLDTTPVRIGMTVDILIEAFRQPNTLLVPARAIIEDEEGKTYVLVEKSIGTDKREIVIGERDTNGNREVLEGLEEGDIVILDPEV